ncbi:MAG: CBS domain-containing protein, partial [Thermoleophilia bacterium]|nr:CBS domain-containing protein [Thermoleophilia bacterium]
MIDRPVRELMDPTTPTVAPDTTIKDLVHLLATNNLDGVAVVDAGNAVVGVVTAQDMLFQEVEADE